MSEKSIIETVHDIMGIYCSDTQAYLVLDAIVNMAYSRIGSYNLDTQNLIRKFKECEIDIDKNIEQDILRIVPRSNTRDRLREYIVKDMECSDILKVNGNGEIYDLKYKLLHNYKEVSTYRLPSLALYTIATGINKIWFYEELYNSAWMKRIDGEDKTEGIKSNVVTLKLENGEGTRTFRKTENSGVEVHILWRMMEALSMLENRMVNLGDIPEKNLEAYLVHKSFKLKFIKYQAFGIGYDIIQKVVTWLKIFWGTPKWKEYKKDPDIKIFFALTQLGKNNRVIKCTEESARGCMKLYELEAHKITDEAIKRYEILK